MAMEGKYAVQCVHCRVSESAARKVTASSPPTLSGSWAHSDSVLPEATDLDWPLTLVPLAPQVSAVDDKVKGAVRISTAHQGVHVWKTTAILGRSRQPTSLVSSRNNEFTNRN
jgi:hypothetical protein